MLIRESLLPIEQVQLCVVYKVEAVNVPLLFTSVALAMLMIDAMLRLFFPSIQKHKLLTTGETVGIGLIVPFLIVVLIVGSNE